MDKSSRPGPPSQPSPSQPNPSQPSAVGSSGTASRQPPVFVRRPDSARRRAWILVLITVAALVPIGVGLAVSDLAGTASVPTGNSAVPVIRVSGAGGSAAGEAAVDPGPYSWTSGGRHVIATRVPVSSRQPLVRVAPDGTLSIAFPAKAIPSSVSLALGDATPGVPVAPSNPVRFEFRKPAGTYSVVVSTSWAQGQVDYHLQVKVG